jgi:death-on-curing protein
VTYLTQEEVVLMHGILLHQFGGSPGIRDAAALEAAIHRPQSGYYPDVISEAAALFESIAINHPFVDGNKRTAFAVMDTFLRLNDMKINTNSKDAYKKIIGMFEGQSLRHELIDGWLRSVCQKSSKSGV